MKELIDRVLSTSERVFKTDTRYIARNGSWQYIGMFASALSGLAIASAFARFLTPTTYGLYKYIQSIASTASAVSLDGMGLSVTQAAARGVHSSLARGVRYALLWNILVGILSLVVASYYALKGDMMLAGGIALSALLFPLYLSFDMYKSYLVGVKEFGRLAKYRIFEAIGVAVILISAAYLSDSPVILVGTYYAAYAGISAVLFFHLRKTIRHVQDASGESADDLFSFGLHNSAMRFLGPIARNIDKIAVFQFLGPAELAIYAFATALPDQLKMVTNLRQLMMPRFAKRTLQEIRRTAIRKATLLTLVVGVIITTYIAAAPYIYALLFPAYIESVWYSQLYALSMLAVGGSVVSAAHTAHKKVKHLYAQTMFQPLLRIVLTLVLGWQYGLLGVVGAVIIARFAGLIFSFILLFALRDDVEVKAA